MPVILPPSWDHPDQRVTPYSSWLNRRELMLAGAASLGAGCVDTGFARTPKSPLPDAYPYTLPELSLIHISEPTRPY